MYQRILIPLDGSELALVALTEGAKLAGSLGATLVLIHVYDQRSGSAEAARRYLDYVREERLAPELAVEIVVRKGPVAEAIIGAAQTQDAGLIVMATHGRSGVQRVVYGSVAEQILRSSTIPILLVRVPGATVEVPGEPAARTHAGGLSRLASEIRCPS